MKHISLILTALALLPATSTLAKPPDHAKAHGQRNKHHQKAPRSPVVNKVYVHDSRDYQQGRYLRNDA